MSLRPDFDKAFEFGAGKTRKISRPRNLRDGTLSTQKTLSETPRLGDKKTKKWNAESRADFSKI